MISYFEPIFIEKFLWESVFSNFCRNRNDAKLKIGLFGRHFETEQFFKFVFAEFWFYLVYIHMVWHSLTNSGGKVVFLGGVTRVSWVTRVTSNTRYSF